MRANKQVSEPKPPEDPDTAMAFSMEGFKGAPPPSLLPRYWAPGWNSVQALNKFQSEVGGPLKGGDPGLRLIEPGPDAQPNYFAPEAAAFSPRKGQLLVVPLWHVFGSESLSMLTSGVAERAPQPYIALGIEDARNLQGNEGEQFELMLGGVSIDLPLRIVPTLPQGVAGLPMGLPTIPYMPLPGWVQVSGVDEGQA
jgi:NADH-quinone oxidoreductase subunit G